MVGTASTRPSPPRQAGDDHRQLGGLDGLGDVHAVARGEGLHAVFGPGVRGQGYGWNAATVGLSLAMVGICAMAVQGLAIGPIVKRLGERRALLLGLVCGAAGFLIFGAAPSGPLFWLGIPVMALWGLAGAATQALMTRLVEPDQQGQLQGAISSVQSVSQLLGPFLFTLTFAYFIGAQAPVTLPGAPFLLASVLLVLALVIAMRATARRAAIPSP